MASMVDPYGPGWTRWGGSAWGAWMKACQQIGSAPPPAASGAQQRCYDWGCMPAAFARAIQALTLNDDCMKLSGNDKTRANGLNPADVLTNIVFGSGSFGHIQFQNKGGGWGVALTTPAGKLPIPVLSGRVTITINEYISPSGSLYWNAGDTTANAELLLHELGHAFNFLRGSGGFAISNLSEYRNSMAFDNIINKTCF